MQAGTPTPRTFRWIVAKRGPNFKYETVLGNQKPQLDYRKGTTN